MKDIYLWTINIILNSLNSTLLNSHNMQGKDDFWFLILHVWSLEVVTLP